MKETVTPIEDEQGNKVINDNLKTATTFNNHFATQFTQENLNRIPNPVKVFQGSSEEELNSITSKLKKLNASKSLGTDQIFPIVLNRCVEELAEPLNALFTKSFQSGQVPQDWIDANVIPIYKKGHHSKPGNYRPVSLTSQVCKVMEFFILESISEHLKQHKLILDSQHGFRPKRSCLSNLLIFLEVTFYIDKGYPVDVIYLDFSKAFDTVPHRRLISTLIAHGITGKTNRWIESWLTDRRQRVCISGAESDWQKVISGVPQGSILGPMLFVIFINEIDSTVVNKLPVRHKNVEASS